MAKITHFTANARPARCVMVLGTTSGAGKSWLTTALCRYYSNQGLKVAPFKAQNMSNNARVVPGPAGVMGEIGSAQYFQALAARAEPEVRMNPLLLKPEADTRSQGLEILGAADLAHHTCGARHHAGVVAHVLRLERRDLEALVAVIAAQRGGEPAFASATGGAKHHDAAGRARICGDVSDFCHGRNDTRYTRGVALSAHAMVSQRMREGDAFCRSTGENGCRTPLPHKRRPGPVQAGPSRNGANHVATD